MIIPHGKHTGKSVELVVLKDPSYIEWILNEPNPNGWLITVKQEILGLIDIFDKKAIIKKCAGQNCDKGATRASLYKDNTRLMWWCDNCDPDLFGVLNGRIHLITSYRDALSYVERYCEGKKSDYEVLIRDLAQAKGLPSRVGEKQVRSFFLGIFSEKEILEKRLYDDHSLQGFKSQDLTF